MVVSILIPEVSQKTDQMLINRATLNYICNYSPQVKSGNIEEREEERGSEGANIAIVYR